MIGAIVIRMVGRTKATRKQISVRPYASGMAHLKLQFTKHERRGTFTVSAIYPTNDFALVRATGVIGTYLELESNQTARLPAIPFISAAFYLRADAGGLRGWSSLVFRRRLNFSRLLTGWSFPSLLVKPTKQPSGGFMKWFRSFSCAVRHVEQHDMRATHEIGSITQERGFFSQGETRV